MALDPFIIGRRENPDGTWTVTWSLPGLDRAQLRLRAIDYNPDTLDQLTAAFTRSPPNAPSSA